VHVCKFKTKQSRFSWLLSIDGNCPTSRIFRTCEWKPFHCDKLEPLQVAKLICCKNSCSHKIYFFNSRYRTMVMGKAIWINSNWFARLNQIDSHHQIKVIISDLEQSTISYRLLMNNDYKLSLRAISNWFLVLFSFSQFLSFICTFPVPFKSKL